jgi:ActR/RegA family two-component response regulator
MTAASEGLPLDRVPFQFRVAQEVSRVRRSGGFLSLAVFSPGPGATSEDLVRRLVPLVRLQDVLGRHPAGLALLMPDTSIDQGERAAERILRAAAGPPDGVSFGAGLASIYGETEGGAEALEDAAEEALADSGPGRVARSQRLTGRPRVLVVDDDQTFAQALADTVSERGFEAHPCTEAGDALERAATDAYSALFVDLVLKNASGLDIVRRSLEVRSRRPVIVMSGYDAAEAVLDALSMGPVLFIRKPIEMRDLESALTMVRQLIPGQPRKR